MGEEENWIKPEFMEDTEVFLLILVSIACYPWI